MDADSFLLSDDDDEEISKRSWVTHTDSHPFSRGVHKQASQSVRQHTCNQICTFFYPHFLIPPSSASLHLLVPAKFFHLQLTEGETFVHKRHRPEVIVGLAARCPTKLKTNQRANGIPFNSL